jgi:hypothetical protein
MEWIRERATTATWAKGHNTAYLLSAAASLLLAALSHLWPHLQPLLSRWIVTASGQGMIIFGLPAWIVFLILALICLIGWLFESLVKAHRDLTPKFITSFDENSGGVSETTLTRQRTGELVDDAKYLRLAVQCISQRSVKSCVANLVRIDRLKPAEEVIWDQDSLPLAWAMVGGLEASIHYLAKRFVDVGRILKRSGLFKLATVVPNRLASGLESPGKYVLTVVVTGDGISKSEQIEIELDGTFDGFRATRATSRAESLLLQSPPTTEQKTQP